MNNEEITNIVKILGLHYTKKYSDTTELRSLRYGKLLIMTDQDQDGSHIKGLVINFLHHNWPALLRHSFVQQFITPIVKVCTCRHTSHCITLHHITSHPVSSSEHEPSIIVCKCCCSNLPSNSCIIHKSKPLLSLTVVYIIHRNIGQLVIHVVCYNLHNH